MATQQNSAQPHVHGEHCGHKRVRHEDHIDFLQDGHLHNIDGGQNKTHTIRVSDVNPDGCQRLPCNIPAQHAEDAERVPHGEHVDYLVNGRLHHVHGDHCDDHGPLLLA